MSENSAAKVSRPGAISALVLLLTINLFNYIDRYVLAAVEPELSRVFGLTGGQSGLLASMFLLAYMFGAPVLGRMAERYSRWKIIAFSVAVWSLASCASGFAVGFHMLLVCRIIVGLGEAGYGPAAPALISDYFSVEKRGRVMALFYLAIPVGSALGYVFGGQINKVWGWRWAFWVFVPLELVLALFCYLRRDPRPTVAAALQPKRSFIADARTLLRIPSYLLNTAAMTAMTFAIGGISFWIPKYMTGRLALQQGLDIFTPAGRFANDVAYKTLLADVNTTFGIIVVIAGIVSTFMGGWLCDKLRPKFRGAYLLISGLAILVAFPCTLAMLWTPFPFAWVAVFGSVFFLFFNTGPANTALANVTSSSMRSTAFALNIFIIHALGDAISPPLVGWVTEKTTWDTAFMLVSLMMVLASVLWLIGSRYLAHDEDAVAEK